MSIEAMKPFNNLIICSLLHLLPSFFPSISVFSSELTLHIRWSKYWSFSFHISPSNEYSGLISLGLTGLVSLLSKGFSRVSSSNTIQKHQFFGAQPSLSNSQILHDCGKTIALTRRTFVGKVMSLLFNMLSSFSSKGQAPFDFMAAITICSDFGAQKKKVSHCFHCFPIYVPWSDGTRCHDLSFLNVEL